MFKSGYYTPEGGQRAVQLYLDKLYGVKAYTSGASAVTLDFDAYKNVITTGGTGGSEDVNVPAVAGFEIGERFLVYLGTRTDASDVVNLNHALITSGGAATTNVDMDAADEWVLLERRDAAWEIIAHNATVAT